MFKDVWLDLFDCKECKINNSDLVVHDICNLLVFDDKGSVTLSIDLKVYNKEQDFRIYMCTKSGEIRPLKESSLFQRNIINDSLCSMHKKINIIIII